MNMKYQTTDELEHFGFEDAYIGDVQVTSGFFHMVLDNVTIFPENSCNRDIRDMRANGLLLKIEDCRITSMLQEGYKVLDANGKLLETKEDVIVEAKDYTTVVKSFVDGVIYSLEKKDDTYCFIIDGADHHTYQMNVAGSHDVEEWERFLNK